MKLYLIEFTNGFKHFHLDFKKKKTHEKFKFNHRRKMYEYMY